MYKRKRERSINISDIPPDVLKIIISYSPREFLPLSRYFCRTTRGLRREINIANTKKYSIDSKSIFKTIFSSFNITTLNVSGWSKWNDTSVQYLSRLMQSGYFKSLNSLYMRHCNNISNKSLHSFLPIIGRNLLNLDLYNCKNVNYKVFGSYNPNLKTLLFGFLKRSDIPVENTANVLDYLFNTQVNGNTRILFPKLQKLQLHNYIGVKSLSPLINIASTLKSLDIRGCTGIEVGEFNLISKLTALEELHIGLPVDAETLVNIVTSCTNISVLDVSESAVTSSVVDAICNNLTMLSRLKLTKCGYERFITPTSFRTINNEFLIKLLSSLSKLSLIDVSHCWRLTNSMLDSITKIASGNNLSKIGVYMCSLDNSKLLYKFNCAGANNVIPVIHNELQIDVN
ncbi:conserved hypothetical protein [Theileria orientalis strain Shintoku]|uniref:F-box domain-containing protein n=1 Tax=Theileria orientalis strain Shintoku TaxID=869250 RepID=J4DAJ4_THEOR|nr:conserved hypothetical protein [Theileria orientalis strain Shintoku]BAM42025.1 conserved hypothetical protein [Theileria orientalis strain Shintoku]|eukprot:XP_009692326.1 conserved hypothetical protein [Theileria orientalis strain Shintoku]